MPIGPHEELSWKILKAAFAVQNKLGCGFLEKVYENAMMVELKATDLNPPVHIAQVLNYLKATGLKVGLLLNFGSPKVYYRRLSLREDGDYRVERS
jgi:hypothetical protein